MASPGLASQFRARPCLTFHHAFCQARWCAICKKAKFVTGSLAFADCPRGDATLPSSAEGYMLRGLENIPLHRALLRISPRSISLRRRYLFYLIFIIAKAVAGCQFSQTIMKDA